jgi:hypothetical protein
MMHPDVRRSDCASFRQRLTSGSSEKDVAARPDDAGLPTRQPRPEILGGFHIIALELGTWALLVPT